jgi:hypothetical protein
LWIRSRKVQESATGHGPISSVPTLLFYSIIFFDCYRTVSSDESCDRAVLMTVQCNSAAVLKTWIFMIALLFRWMSSCLSRCLTAKSQP